MSVPILFMQSQGAGALIVNFLPIIAIIAIFYVLVILPASKQRKKTEAMLASLKKGDKVLTTGGIYGQVQSVDGETVWLRIADNVKIKIAKTAVTALVEGPASE